MALILDKFIEPIRPAFGPEAAAIVLRGVEAFARGRMERQRLQQNQQNLDRRFAAEQALTEKQLGLQERGLQLDEERNNSEQRRDIIDFGLQERALQQRDDISRAERRLKQDAAARQANDKYIDSLSRRKSDARAVFKDILGSKIQGSGEGGDKAEDFLRLFGAISATLSGEGGGDVTQFLKKSEDLGVKFTGKAEDLFEDGDPSKEILRKNLDVLNNVETELDSALRTQSILSQQALTDAGFVLPTPTENGTGENPQASTSGEVGDNSTAPAVPQGQGGAGGKPNKMDKFLKELPPKKAAEIEEILKALEAGNQ